jgi:hypothetical protein
MTFSLTLNDDVSPRLRSYIHIYILDLIEGATTPVNLESDNHAMYLPQ